jgi:hypothetical protein
LALSLAVVLPLAVAKAVVLPLELVVVRELAVDKVALAVAKANKANKAQLHSVMVCHWLRPT